MKHRGDILKRGIDASGKTVIEVAQAMGKSRAVLYQWFNRPDLPLKSIAAVAKVIGDEFLKTLPEKDKKEIRMILNISETAGIIDYRQKYLEQLEENNRLLKQLAAYKRKSA